MWSKAAVCNALQYDKKIFSHFISSPLCSYSSSRHQSSEVKDYVMNLEVEGKVSVLMGLAEASAKYQHKDESSTKREVISLSCSVYARKGFFIPDKERPTYTDKGMDFTVEGMEIGLEDVLIVTTEYQRDDKRTEDTVELKARVLFFSISAKMKSIHQSSGVKGFVLIDHYSSATQSWERMEYYGDCYSKALAEVERIEDHMCNIPNIVDQTFYGDLPHVRFMLSPNVADTDNIDLYLELQNNINAIHVHLAEIQESKEFCNDSADDEDNFTRLLEELGNINIENCSWEFLESIKKRKK